MSASTPYLNLYKPGGGSSGLIVPDEVVDIDRINTNMDSIDTWASDIGTKMAAQLSRNQQYRGLTANIGSVTSPVKGDTYQETDALLRKFEYDGSTWVLTAGGGVGPVFLVPGSVAGTGVTINANGKRVDFVGSTNVSVNGIFQAGYKAFRINFHMFGGSDFSTMSLRLRNAGTDDATANYWYSHIKSNGASGTGSASSWPFQGEGRSRYAGDFLIHNPNQTIVTEGVLNFAVRDTAGARARYAAGFEHNVATAFDGFSIIAGGTTVSGSLSVEGLI